MAILVVEVAGIEPATPYCLQLYDIIRYNQTYKIANRTGVMGQVYPITPPIDY